MAFSGNFNRKADSHLVCVETDGTHATQTISCRTSSKKRGPNLMNLDALIFFLAYLQIRCLAFYLEILIQLELCEKLFKSVKFLLLIK